MQSMKAVVFRGVGDLRIEDVPRPKPKAGEAVIRITATTICGTDVHIVKGEYPVSKGLILGHEPVGVVQELGSGLDEDYAVGQIYRSGRLKVEKERIKAFAAEFDPQPFHLDDRAANASIFAYFARFSGDVFWMS